MDSKEMNNRIYWSDVSNVVYRGYYYFDWDGANILDYSYEFIIKKSYDEKMNPCFVLKIIKNGDIDPIDAVNFVKIETIDECKEIAVKYIEDLKKEKK